jgi:hypothetical protein
VNVVAPWVINTPILPEGVAEYLEARGGEFALAEDAAKVMLKIASDRDVNGEFFSIDKPLDAKWTRSVIWRCSTEVGGGRICRFEL